MKKLLTSIVCTNSHMKLQKNNIYTASLIKTN